MNDAKSNVLKYYRSNPHLFIAYYEHAIHVELLPKLVNSRFLQD